MLTEALEKKVLALEQESQALKDQNQLHKQEIDAIMAKIDEEREACLQELAVLKATVEEVVAKANEPTTPDEQEGDGNTATESESGEE